MDRERASHVLRDCEPIFRLRLEIFGELFLTPNSPWTPAQLDSFLSEERIVGMEGSHEIE